jgi:hypothetical protein
LAKEVGITEPPFRYLTPLPPDNGERFFSEYLFEQKKRNMIVDCHPQNDRCQCEMCACKKDAIWHEHISPKTLFNPYLEKNMQIADSRKNSSAKLGKKTIYDNEEVIFSEENSDLVVVDKIPAAAAVVPHETAITAPPSFPTQQYQQQVLYNMVPNPYGMMPNPYGMVPNTMWNHPYQPNCATTNFPMIFPPQYPYQKQQLAVQPRKTQTEDCCQKRAWHRQMKRKGRPPHDDNCHTKLAWRGTSNPFSYNAEM